MTATGRAALLGGGLALVFVAAVLVLVSTGTVTLPSLDGDTPERVLVITTAPEDDALSAPFAFVITPRSTSAELLDTTERVVISGTSAQSARDAYPFVGGAGVARALAPQTGGEPLEWVVLPPDEWAGLVDEVGGVQVDLPVSISVYRDGTLAVLEAGARRLTGEEAVALASALPFVEREADRKRVSSQLSAGIAAAVTSMPERLGELVAEKRAESSLDAEALGVFSAE